MNLRQLKLQDILSGRKLRVVKYIYVLILLFFLPEWSQAVVENRPEHFGMALAYLELKPILDSNMFLPYNINRLTVTLIFEIDKKGRVTKVRTQNPADSNFVKYYTPFLKTTRFVPGEFKGKKTKQYLPVRLFFKPNQRIPELECPVSPEGQIIDQTFYFEALGLNDIKVPQIEFFPSYSFFLKTSYSEIDYPYFLLKLSLDQSGLPTRIEKIKGEAFGFTSQILTAVNWGRYSPLRIKGKKVASENFLLITFLPQMSYPSSPIDIHRDTILSMEDRFRVRLFPDTVGLFSKPLPKNIIDEQFVCSDSKVIVRGDVTVLVAVDTLGKARLIKDINIKKELKQATLALLSHLEFFPAFDNAGSRIQFEGVLRLEFTHSRNVKVHINWLPH